MVLEIPPWVGGGGAKPLVAHGIIALKAMFRSVELNRIIKQQRPQKASFWKKNV